MGGMAGLCISGASKILESSVFSPIQYVQLVVGCFLGYFMGLLGLGANLFNILFTLIMGVLLWYIDNYYLHMYAHIQAIFLWILLLVK